MLWIIISILSAIILVCGYVIYNLHRKLVVAETVTSSYFSYLDRVSKVLEFVNSKVEELDSTDSFKSDDEIGFFFNEIKKLNSLLSDFTITK
jgi:hypothetical protein